MTESSARQTIVPARLKAGDTLRAIAPSCSRTFVMEYDNTAWINQRMEQLGFALEFGAHIEAHDDFLSAPIASRAADLHAAFADPQVNGILSVIGGFNANELLPYLDWELIAANPKVVCGYSDFTVLANAVHAKTGLLTYVGPHWSSFGMRDHFEPTGSWFSAATGGERWSIEPSETYTDDLWFMDQDARTVRDADGPWVLREGEAAGVVIGGNLCTFNLLAGTGLMPELAGSVVFAEEDSGADVHEFARQLASLLQQPGAEQIAALAIGRFQQASEITREQLEALIAKFPVLAGKPVVANLDFGHTSPMFTLPIGGWARVEAARGTCVLDFAHRRGDLP